MARRNLTIMRRAGDQSVERMRRRDAAAGPPRIPDGFFGLDLGIIVRNCACGDGFPVQTRNLIKRTWPGVDAPGLRMRRQLRHASPMDLWAGFGHNCARLCVR